MSDSGEVTVPAAPGTVSVSISSFGFKHGVPEHTEWMIDARMVRNPFWVLELRPHTGQDAPVRDYVLADPVAVELIARTHDLLWWSAQRYVERGRDVMHVAIGCTGGRHRSVAIVEALAATLRNDGLEVAVTHRDIDVPDPRW